MNEDQYREKGRQMTLDFLEEKGLYIRVYGTFNGSDVSINEYHDPAEIDREHFYFHSRHNFQYDFLTAEELTATEI